MTSATEHDVTTIRLPHTGLHVPDATLSVAAYRQIQTHDGVAFTASLRVCNRKVGLIENGGTGGPTNFYPDKHAVYGTRELDEYASRCRTEEDGTVTAERLLDELVEEQQAAKWVTKVTRCGEIALRQIDQVLDEHGQPLVDCPVSVTQMVSNNKPATAADTQLLAKELLRKYGTDGWWQMWNGAGWHDITPRPANVAKDLYC